VKALEKIEKCVDPHPHAYPGSIWITSREPATKRQVSTGDSAPPTVNPESAETAEILWLCEFSEVREYRGISSFTQELRHEMQWCSLD
jgi:hypothetical protein